MSSLRNPFYHRQAVSGPENFYGRSELLQQVTEMIRSGQSCALVGERRIGKSSLLALLADPRGHDPWLDPGERLVAVSLDFLGLRQAEAGDLWAEILEALDDAGATLSKAEASFAGVRQTLRALSRDGVRIALCFDEFELAVENPRLDESFFGALRSLAGSCGVAFVTASRLSLLELDQYRDEAVRRKVLGSPFFNIFAEFLVGPFESVEVAELLEGSLCGRPVRFSSADALFLDRVAGRHPYFLQVAAYHLYESLARPAPLERARIYAEVGEKLGRDAAKIFRNLWQHSRPGERRTLRRLATPGERGAPLDPAALEQLEWRGLVRKDGGKARLFSATFADWLQRNAETLDAAS